MSVLTLTINLQLIDIRLYLSIQRSNKPRWDDFKRI